MPVSTRKNTRCWLQATSLFILLFTCLLCMPAMAQNQQTDPLPSWREGKAKAAIIAFVNSTTDAASPDFVAPSERVVTFDQDGTTWVEQPLYPQFIYCFEQLAVIAKQKPEIRDVEPFKTALSGDREAIAKFSPQDFEKIFALTLTGMSVEAFNAHVKAWIESTKHPRWQRPYTELVYQPMLEVMQLFREKGYKTYFVTGGEQDFVRVFAQRVYGILPEQVVGTASATTYGFDAGGKPFLTKAPKLLLADDGPGKPQGIHLMIGRHPNAAFGNSVGDQQMLEYTQAGGPKRLMVLVHHDDEVREYAYGPKSPVGTFTEELMAKANKEGWVVISMKNDWQRIFSWE